MEKLREVIEELIDTKREGDYWDFKKKHHQDKVDLVHDIICMANNRVDRDAYIIFGVEDETFDVVGIEDDINRRNQQGVIDILKSKKFSAGIRPQIEMRTIHTLGHEIDVMIIKNSTDTPYFLLEDFVEGKRRVRANYIYTRVGDTNTDIDKTADINNIEYLWKKRFLLTRPPFEQILNRLEKKQEWQKDGYVFFNKYNPEFTIVIKENDDSRLLAEFYAYAMINESIMYQSININYYGTKLYGIQSVVLDSGRYSTPVPEWEFLNFGEYSTDVDYAFKYFIKGEPSYILNQFLYDSNNSEEVYARSRLFEVILLFENEEEKIDFTEYINDNKKILEETLDKCNEVYSWIKTGNESRDKQVKFRLKLGKVLNKMLLEYRRIYIEKR